MAKIIYLLLLISFCNSIYGWVKPGTDLKELTDTVLSNKTLPDPQVLEPKSGIIFPGTKWCGPGNKADNYDDLGTEASTDVCCRAHDHCPDIMDAGASKHNLTNSAFYTRLHCRCDNEFLHCLRNADTFTSRTVGVIYFNAIFTQCFRDDFPVVKCNKKGGWLNKKCVEYEFDVHGTKRYQWFDVPDFM